MFIGYFLVVPSQIKLSFFYSDMSKLIKNLIQLNIQIKKNEKLPKKIKEIIIVPISYVTLIYDLLDSLLNGTIISVIVSIIISSLVVIFITQRFCTSLSAIFSIILIIITTISIILWLGKF